MISKVKGVAVALSVLFLLVVQNAAAEEGMKVKYKAGDGLRISDEENEFHLSSRVQGRFTFNKFEAARYSETFAIPRGKIKIDGYTLNKKLKFDFQMNLATRNRATTAAACTNAGCTATANAVTAESTTGLATLEDYNVDWIPSDYFGIKVGQYKVPFLMQELTSSGRQQFVDRALSTGFFNLTRDIGVTLHGDLLDYRLNYALFVMNGDGLNELNRNQSPMFGLRLEVPVLGQYKPSESDVDYSEEHQLGFGLAYVFNERVSTFENGTIGANIPASHGTFDAGFKSHGFSVQSALMLSRTHDGPEITNWGYNVQTGWFFIPKHLEAAVRGSGTLFSGAVANQYEYAAGLNYFIKGHGLKLQTDYAILHNNSGAGLNDHRVRSQLQVIF